MSSSTRNDPISPRRLELSLNPGDGSLLTAPLSTVLLAATDGLHTDLYNMAHGELEFAQARDEDDEDAAGTAAGALNTTKKERMSNLSFAQRRNELGWRLAQHGKALTHVSALTAAAASTDFSRATRVSTKALQHARTAWVQADEAQDALYFFHAQLFPARQPPHDVYGALDLLNGQWTDLPTDLRLQSRYDTCQERDWSRQEVSDRWHMAVRDKLVRGEYGSRPQSRLWKLSLRGGILRLTYGTPKRFGDKTRYPIEALLSVFSTSVPAPWTLLSVEVHTQPKTGESSHQLETSHRQRYNLHRLCSIAMARDPERPLQAMFQVAHTFALAWMLEILSAQAQALRKGVWAAGDTHAIVVTPVTQGTADSNRLGILSISFWSIDDRYGPPSMGDLILESQSNTLATDATIQDVEMNDATDESNNPTVTNQLTLSIWAQRNVGIRVSLTGNVVDYADQPHIRSTIQNLLEAASNPFALSASDALLAAARLCAERKCHAVVNALQPILPKWMQLTVKRESILIAARINYPPNQTSSPFVGLFRLACDSRTGCYVATFSRSALLLRCLACNHSQASESTSLRIASLAKHRRRGAGASSVGRTVRDAFESLARSMNVLSQRTGVGGSWKDKDALSAKLRARAIQQACVDASVSLTTCCGMAALYGLSALALGVATGVAATPDMAGGNLEDLDGLSFLATPAVSVLLEQQLIETSSTAADGERKARSFLEQELFAMSCRVTQDALELYGLDVTVHLDSPSAIPNRKGFVLTELVVANHDENGNNGNEIPPAKRVKMDTEYEPNVEEMQPLMAEVERLATTLSNTLDLKDGGPMP